MNRESSVRQLMCQGLVWTFFGLLAGLPSQTRADVKVPAIFGSHMVLQRDQKDRVWGWAEPGESVTVKIAGQSHTTKAGPDGSWQVTLEAMPAGGPHVLSIQGKNSLELDDVLVGEVWICSGQSNMQWSVAGARDADLELATAKYPGIRLITVPNLGTQEPQKDFQGAWQTCRPETAAGFSAVGYFFGRQLHQARGVPVGLINDAWGGSACEAWIRRDVLAADPKFAQMLKHGSRSRKTTRTPRPIMSQSSQNGSSPPRRPRMMESNRPRPRRTLNG